MSHLISAHQPAFCAWPGYLHRIMLSDQFVILDNVQFEKGSYTNRNKILGPNGAQWITVPVLTSSNFKSRITELQISKLNRWRTKMIRSIETCYSGAPFFKKHIDFFRVVLSNEEEKDLVGLCDDILVYLLGVFKINTPILKLSTLDCNGHKDSLILSICERLEATHFLFGPNGKDYVSDEMFISKGVLPLYHKYTQNQYPQMWKPELFHERLSAIDMLFNVEEGSLLECLTLNNYTRDDLVGKGIGVTL